MGLGLRELQIGNTIKLEFSNGNVVKGLYTGTDFYTTSFTKGMCKADKAHHLLYFDFKEKVVKNMTFQELENRVGAKLKEITRTRLQKELSEYLRVYLKKIMSVQEMNKKIFELEQKHQKEQAKLNKLSGEINTDLFKVEEEQLKLSDKLQLFMTESIQERSSQVKLVRFGYVDKISYGGNNPKQAGFSFQLHFEGRKYSGLSDTFINDYAEMEYDNTARYSDESWNAGFQKNVEKNFPHATSANFKRVVKGTKNLKMTTTHPIQYIAGSYSGKHDLCMFISVKCTDKLTRKDTDELASQLVLFVNQYLEVSAR